MMWLLSIIATGENDDDYMSGVHSSHMHSDSLPA